MDKCWWGYIYKRWFFFIQCDLLNVLVELDFFVYMVNGSLDENLVLSVDYIKLEFICQGKQNFIYKIYFNYDY